MRWIAVILIFLFSACGGESAETDAGTDGGIDAGGPDWTPASCLADPKCPLPMVSAHRGLCGAEPENTIAGVLECEALGLPMVEIDTRETADGHIVIMHDEDVVRTTDGETRFPGRVDVGVLSLAEFSQLVIDDDRCLLDPDSQPARCHPPTLEQLLLATSWTTIMVDFKDGDAGRLAELVRDLGVSERVLFFDSSLGALHAYRAVLPDGVVMGRASSPEDFQSIIDAHHDELEFRWMHGDPSPITEVAALLKPHGIRLYLDTFTSVDVWLEAAASTGDETQKQQYLDQAWQTLDGILAEGALGLGVEFAHRYAGYLYPNGFGW